jgi:hypothetical protein
MAELDLKGLLVVSIVVASQVAGGGGVGVTKSHVIEGGTGVRLKVPAQREKSTYLKQTKT